MPGLEFAFSTHGAVVLVAIVCAVALSVWFYRTTLPPVPRTQRTLLAILRALALSIVAFLIFSPTLRILGTSSERPEVSVLLDNSKSMRLTDREGNRAAILRSLVSSQVLSRLARNAELRYSTFGLHTRAVAMPASDTLSFDEEATDIAAALQQQALERSRRNVRAVILLTDGMYTLGENPLSRADALGMPVYTVGIGDSSQPKDLSIAQVAANTLVTSGSITPVEITVQSSGFDGERVEVRLEEGSTFLDRREITLGEGTRTYPVRLNYRPERDGALRLTARVSVLPGEVTPANNTRTLSIRVLKSALKILMIAGSPEPDVPAVRQSLAEQPNLAIRSFTELRDGSFADGHLPLSAVDSCDCLVLIGMPTANTSAEVISVLNRILNERGVPLLYISGKGVATSRLSQLGNALPFGLAAVTPAELSVSVLPAETQRGNPLIDLETEGSFEAWKRLPPIYRSASPIRILPGTTVLANSSAQSILPVNPLIVTRTLARQKSLAILGYGVWRWRLMGQEDPATQHLFDAFLFAGIRWLTSPEDSRRFKVNPARDVVPLGEPAEFTAQLYGNAAEPLSDARVRIVVTSGQHVAEADLQPVGNGRYTGSVAGLAEGLYRFRATAEWHGGSAGADSGSFSVGGLDLEFRDPRMNVQLLRQLAYRTGGRFFTPASADLLDSVMTAQQLLTTRELRSVTDIELWHSRTLLIILIVLLAAEWALRKWLGMV